jgi:hypothetical protein
MIDILFKGSIIAMSMVLCIATAWAICIELTDKGPRPR